MAGLGLGVVGCGGPQIPESTLRATIEKRSFDLSRERIWILTALEAGYADTRGYLWLEGEGLSERGRDLLSALERAGAEGLDPRAYEVPDVREALDTLPAIPEADSVGRTRALADVEIRLSTGLMSFARDLVLGRLDPREARQDWRIEPEPLPPDLLGRTEIQSTGCSTRSAPRRPTTAGS
jgi:murein L,D-transpeptidase YcbB/YkuD